MALPLTDRVESSMRRDEVMRSSNVTDRNEMDNNEVVPISTIDAENLKIADNGVVDQKFESENANVAIGTLDTIQTQP